jgi:imidazolonepropionase-like amidohydrolase
MKRLAWCAAALWLAACDSGPVLVQRPASAPPALLIRNVAVLDVDRGERAAGRDVLVRGARIERIDATGAVQAGDAQVIDGSGATLLPGLIDMHGHVGNSPAPSWLNQLPDAKLNLRSYLYCGVTTVLDPAGMDNETFRLRDDIAAGTLLGPRMFVSGPMVTARGGHPVAIIDTLAPWWIRWYLVKHFTRQVDTPDQARAVADEIAALHADVLKLSVDHIPEAAPRLSRETLAAAVAQARTHGLRAVAHIGSLADAIDAGDAGVALWMHGVEKDALDDAAVDKLKAYGIGMVPTIGVFDSYALLGQGPRVATALERETVPAATLAAFDHPPASSAAGDFFRPYLEKMRPMRPVWRENVRRLHAAGVTILAGSDTQMGVFPGPGLHRELALLVESGLTPAQAIRAATSDAARFLAEGKQPEFGAVAPGKLADLLLVEGDPTANLDALARIRAVIRNGVMLERTPIAQ